MEKPMEKAGRPDQDKRQQETVAVRGLDRVIRNLVVKTLSRR
ncbi:MAG: hypothetical protein ACPLRW_11945 [Moorellales bacterium]